ncbi:hypothetical protein DFJ74DRAFT_48459 [Hyaloraphidium curvatum]|nr:hypothetical protein DFJ74DRAFT_48459 [Hyaloraphidium curvatum]
MNAARLCTVETISGRVPSARYMASPTPLAYGLSAIAARASGVWGHMSNVARVCRLVDRRPPVPAADPHPDDELGFALVGDGEDRLELVLRLVEVRPVIRDPEHVVDVDGCEDPLPVIRMTEVETRICRRVLEAHALEGSGGLLPRPQHGLLLLSPVAAQGGVQLAVPLVACLPEPVERPKEAEHAPPTRSSQELLGFGFRRGVKVGLLQHELQDLCVAFRLPHEQQFLQFAEEVRQLHVSVSGVETGIGEEGNEEADGAELGRRSEDLLEVDALLLREALRHQPRLLLLLRAVRVVLGLIGPFAANRAASGRQRRRLDGVALNDAPELGHESLQPCLPVRAGQGFLEGGFRVPDLVDVRHSGELDRALRGGGEEGRQPEVAGREVIVRIHVSVLVVLLDRRMLAVKLLPLVKHG